MMYEFIQAGELRAEAKRLLRYRFPLILAVLVNLVFLVRVPIAGMRAETAPPQNAETTTSEPTGPTAPARTPRSSARVNATNRNTQVAPSAAAVASVPNKLAPPNISPSLRSAGVSPFSFTSTWGTTGQRLFARWSVPLRQSAPAPARSSFPSRTPLPIQPRLPVRRPLPSRSPRLRQHPHLQRIRATYPKPCPHRSLHSHPPSWHRRPPHSPFATRSENEGPVSFLVNGRVCELQPGEAHEFAAGTSWIVQFHRGESFGNAEQTLGPGVFHFVVTDQGWDLNAAR